jgi:parvulin-like peptidyl-prolyl isomerase
MQFRAPIAVAALAVLAALTVLVSCGGSEAPDDGRPAAGPSTGARPNIPDALPEPRIDPEKPVATVNGTEILAQDVHGLARVNLSQIQQSGQTITEEMEWEMLRVSLELLIDNELMVQQARTEDLQVTPEQIEAHVQGLRDLAGSPEAFRQYLDLLGLTEEELLVEAERNVLAIEYAQAIGAKVKVGAEEAKKFYDEHPKMFQEPEKVGVSQILLRARRDDPEEKRASARQRAEEARARIVAGEEFAAMAREYSQIPNAADGGVVSPFPRGVMVPEFEKMAFEMKDDELSPVFETVYGYNVIRKTGAYPPEPIPFEEVAPTLMLELSKRRQQEAVTARAAELRAGAEVVYLDDDLAPREDRDEQGEDEPAG